MALSTRNFSGRETWLLFSQATTVALALLFVVVTLKPEWLGRQTLPLPVDAMAAAPAPRALPGGTAVRSYAAAAKRATPTVVSITASRNTRNPHANAPWFQRWMEQHGGQGGGHDNPERSDAQVGLGSGVIVSADGYLLTNSHVIDRADDIEVMLADGRRAQAKVVGTDPETDVAVLKIALDQLPAAVFGNADALQVGDVVLAIGNPFGVGQTVTAGIVSALRRNQLGINTFENFIQTDAAINPGNSGGALIDVDGNLLGINTAIYSRSGGSLGIGFAIPVTTARQVMDGLIRDGRVTRGWIGVEPRDLTPEIAQTFHLPIQQGVLITGVLQNGPASTGGILPGDVVVRVGDAAVVNTSQLLDAVAALKPQATAAIAVQRGGRAMELRIKVAQRPPGPALPTEPVPDESVE